MSDLGRSVASGWKVEPYFSGDSWFWSAYGPRGARQGKTVGRARAEQLAQQAERELAAPPKPLVGADDERTALKAQGERLLAARRAAKTQSRRHYG